MVVVCLMARYTGIKKNIGYRSKSVQVKYLLRISNTEGCLPVTKELFEGTDFGTLICLYTTGAD